MSDAHRKKDPLHAPLSRHGQKRSMRSHLRDLAGACAHAAARQHLAAKHLALAADAIIQKQLGPGVHVAAHLMLQELRELLRRPLR